MLKRTVLATAVAALTIPAATAAPYQPMDARGLAMGNTGVASAMRAHAPAYNPSMLAQEFGKDGFAILLPQVGVSAADEKEMVDTAQDIADYIFPRFEDAVQMTGTGLEDRINALQQSITSLETSINNFNFDQTPTAIANIKAANNNFSTNADLVDTSLINVQSATKDLTDSLQSISGNPLAAKVGLGTTLAIPSKKFSAAVSLSGTANISARVNFSDNDINLLNSYAPAARGYVAIAQDISGAIDDLNENASTPAEIQAEADKIASAQNKVTNLKNYTDGDGIFIGGDLKAEPDLDSTVELVAVAVVDVGVSFAREFDFGGHAVAIGVTPKIQKISTFHYGDEVDGFDDIETDDVREYQKDYTDFNLDIGASYRFGANNNWMAGAVIKNILGGSYAYQDIDIKLKDSDGNIIPGATKHLHGGEVKLNPQVRGGIAYHSKWFNAAFDLDLIKNKAVAYEAETQYASLGVEFDVFRTLQLRAGYRANLVSGGTDVVTAGFGLSPFGVHIDVAAMANPSDYLREAGAVMDLGFYF